MLYVCTLMLYTHVQRTYIMRLHLYNMRLRTCYVHIVFMQVCVHVLCLCINSVLKDFNGEDSICSTCILCTCSLFFQSFPDKFPSDVGVLGILEHIPVWYDLAVKLGVPYAKVHRSLAALLYWRNGNWGEDIPNTWGFLLETVEKGPLVAKR